MKKYIFKILLTVVMLTFLVEAANYEIRMTFDPPNATPQMILRHPTSVNNHSNFYASLDCGPITTNPDWGVQSYTHDNPEVKYDSIDGVQIITSERISDPGECSLLLACGVGSATCNIEVVNWPGFAPQSFQVAINETSPLMYITNLPCAKDIGLKIIKASQVRSGAKWMWVKIIAEFDQELSLKPISNHFNTSLQFDHWFGYDYGDEAKVNKKRNKITFYGADKVSIKTKNKRVKLFAKAYHNYQGEKLPVFININGYSGVETIILDRKSKYKAPKE